MSLFCRNVGHDENVDQSVMIYFLIMVTLTIIELGKQRKKLKYFSFRVEK